jgi:hypothetical protein
LVPAAGYYLAITLLEYLILLPPFERSIYMGMETGPFEKRINVTSV